MYLSDWLSREPFLPYAVPVQKLNIEGPLEVIEEADEGNDGRRGGPLACREQVDELLLENVPGDLLVPQRPRPELSELRRVRAGAGSFLYVECVEWR